MEETNKDEMASELDFLEAMNAYRRAKDTGDAELIAKAEDALRETVRTDLIQRMQ